MTAFGKYRLLRRLGSGGMAEAYLAEQEGHAGFARTVVVKRVLPHLADKPEFTRMLVHEARIAARLQHDNIAQIYDLGHVGDTYFITMEYVAGVELATLCELAEFAHRTPLPYGPIARIILDVCAGLHHAHGATDTLGRPLGLVHRDVSPPNVMVTREGTTKLIDFGVAKATAEAGETAAGAMKGKHAYMSPEQVRGRPLDARSDLFAVGILLWELVTGKRLFRRDADYLTVRAVVEDEPPPLAASRPGVPERLEHIVARALEKDPDDRYISCEELADDLEDLARRSGWDITSRSLGKLVSELSPA
jgi:serine/threonine-protein kinase